MIKTIPRGRSQSPHRQPVLVNESTVSLPSNSIGSHGILPIAESNSPSTTRSWRKEVKTFGKEVRKGVGTFVRGIFPRSPLAPPDQLEGDGTRSSHNTRSPNLQTSSQPRDIATAFPDRTLHSISSLPKTLPAAIHQSPPESSNASADFNERANPRREAGYQPMVALRTASAPSIVLDGPPCVEAPESSNSPLQQNEIVPRCDLEVSMPASKRIARSAKNAGRQLLEIATESSDAFPPLKSALGGIRAAIKMCDQYSGNKAQIKALEKRLGTLEAMRLAETIDATETSRRNDLQQKLDVVSNKVKNMGNQNTFERMTNVSDNENTIATCVDDIRVALTDYQVSLQQQLLMTGIAMIEKVDLLLLKQLPHAKDAGYLAGNHRKCLRGTRREVLETIGSWAKDSTGSRIYWLRGPAGTGKSTISQSFAEDCFAEGILGASFFCSGEFIDRSNLKLIFPTIALHLAYRYPQYRAALLPALNLGPIGGYESLSDQLEMLLIAPLKASGISTIIVIDALDECKDDKPASSILSLLANHVHSIPLVKIFVTGRPEPPIRLGFRLPLLQSQTSILALHEIERTSVDQDIRLYLKEELSQLVSNRSNLDITYPWPKEADLESLVRRAQGLFIFASTTCKFVGSPNDSPPERLQMIVDLDGDTSYEGSEGIDRLYTRILEENLLQNLLPTAADRLKAILGTVSLALDPLSLEAFGIFLGLQSNQILTSIRPLHSLILVPESPSGTVRVLHKSFPDYLLDSKRCKNPKFHVDSGSHHGRLAISCLGVMKNNLKRNICDIPRYLMNNEVADLEKERERHISGAVEYACTFWAQHLLQASKSNDMVANIIQETTYFMRHNFLLWLEVLSLSGTLRTAVHSLRAAKSWLDQLETPDKALIGAIQDGERFILHFFDTILTVSASHIHESAVTLSPKNSIIRQFYQDQSPRSWNTSDDSWGACIRKIEITSGECVIFSHKGDCVAASGGYEETNFLLIIEAATGIVLTTLKGHMSPVVCVAFSPDDSLLVSGSEDYSVRLWDIRTGDLVTELKMVYEVRSVGFSQDGNRIACDFGIWDGRLEQPIHKFEKGARKLAWLPTKSELVLVDQGGDIKILDAKNETYRVLSRGYGKSARTLACSRDGSRIALGSDEEITVYHAETGDTLQSIPAKGVRSLCFSYNGERLVYAHSYSMVIHDLANPTDVIEFRQSKSTRSVSVSSDGTSIALADDGKLSIWKMDGLIRSGETPGQHWHSDIVSCVAISPDSSFIASGSRDKTLKLWDPETGLCSHTFEAVPRHGWAKCVAISPDSSLVAFGFTGEIWIWRVLDHSLVCIVGLGEDLITGVTFSPDSQRIASISDVDEVVLCEIEGKEKIGILNNTELPVQLPGIRFSDDGTGITVFDEEESRSWKLMASSECPSEDTDPAKLPIVFIRQEEAFEDRPHESYTCTNMTEWIQDQQGRHVCWLPPDLRSRVSHIQGSKVAIGTRSGRVCWFDFGEDN